MEFSIDKKTGFKTKDFELKIFDSNGNVFYSKKNKNFPLPMFFNLPKGKYLTFSNIELISKPVFYQLPKLYPREKNIPLKRLKINLIENGNKARIDVVNGKIDFSPSFLDSKPQTAFLFWHEIGHFFYYNEHKCDRFAENKMLKYGFNPSQVAECVLKALNCNIKSSFERQKKVFKSQKNIK